ncbi:TPA: hypothetical protein QCZ04_003471 [Bacillus cereus]|nr:hypothetical protein [Bacillus cereus]
MKKRLSLMIVTALVFGSLTACGDSGKVEKVETKQVSSDTKNKSANKEVTTKRTVDLKGESYPWRYASRDIIQNWQNKGETVYLWSDAEGIEKFITEEINRDSKHKQEDMPINAGYTQLFIDEVKKQLPDQKDYFSKMSEVVNDLQSMNLDSAKSKIEEAKKLREAK